MNSKKTFLESSYDSDKIQVLEGLESVRKNPGMYIGSTDTRGLHHLVYEVVDNSVDEALAGYCTTVQVTIMKNGAICVDDNGTARSPALVKSFPVRIETNCAALFVSFSSGYWSKTAWETRNVPKNQASGVVESWLSEESVKRIDRWTPATAQPLTDGLELTPLSDPARLKPGDKLTVLVTEHKQPRAGVPVAYGGDTRGASGEDGKVAIRLRQGGMQLIEASLETRLADGKADTLIRATTLQFELPQ